MKTIDSPSKYYPLVSGLLINGASLDAGTCQVVDNNISHLARISQRHLDWWPYKMSLIDYGGGAGTTPYTGYVDASEPTTPLDYQILPWANKAGAVILGPYDLIADRETDYGLTLRKIRVVVSKVVANGTDKLQLFFALTPDRESPWNGIFYTFSGPVVAANGTTKITYDLDAAVIAGNTQLRYVTRVCRDSGARGSRTVQCVPATVAIGAYGIASGQSIAGISVYEVRD